MLCSCGCVATTLLSENCRTVSWDHKNHKTMVKLAASDLPNLQSLLRFQKQMYAGKFSRSELEDLFSSEAVQHQAAAIHNDCAEVYNKFRKSQNKKSFMRNVVCLGIAVCPDEMNGWYNCMREAADNQQSQGQCQRYKRSVERCSRDTTKKILRASLDDLFQSKHG